MYNIQIVIVYEQRFNNKIDAINLPAITALVDATAGIMCLTTPSIYIY